MNKYDVLGVVGEGAYGVVLKCKNKDTNEVVAIKKFKESEEDEVVRKTTLREVKILRMMRHENIVQLKEAFRRKGKLYLVFEYVERSMLDVLEENPCGVHTEKVRVLMFQLLKAVEHCHRHDVIHRDIKPENLLINPVDSALRLCDFGFARTANPGEVLTDYVATRWYRAPELLLGSTQYGKDVDLWAFGCIMGELTDGQPLFAGETEVDQLFVIQKVMGPLTPEHMEMFSRNPRFLGIQFPDVSRPETLQKRYITRMQKPQMQLMQGVLNMEPKRRLAALDALKIPWFEGVKLPKSLRQPADSQEQSFSSTAPAPVPTAMGPPRSGVDACVAGTQALQVATAPPATGGGRHAATSGAPQPWYPEPAAERPQSQQREEPQRAGESARKVEREDAGHARGVEPRLAHARTAEDPRALREDPRSHGEDMRFREDHQFGARQQQFSPPQSHTTNRPYAYMLPWEAGPAREEWPPQAPAEPSHAPTPGREAEEKLNAGDGRRPRRRPGTGEQLAERPSPGPLAGATDPRASAGAGSAVAVVARPGPSAGTGGSEEWPFALTQSRVPQWLREQDCEDDAAVWSGPGAPRRAPARGPPGSLAAATSTPLPVRRSPELPDGVAPDQLSSLRGLPSIHHQSSLLSDGSHMSRGGAGQLDSSRVREEELARQLIFGGGGRWNGGSSTGPAPTTSPVPIPSDLGPVRDGRGQLHHEELPGPARDGRGGGGLARRSDLSGSYRGH